MSKWINGLMMAALALSPMAVEAHKATERYIPLGYAAGTASQARYIGRVTAFSAARKVLTISGEQGVREVRLTPDTRIWLDRSRAKKPNIVGQASDLETDRRVEVKFADPDTRRVAEWIKIEVAQ